MYHSKVNNLTLEDFEYFLGTQASSESNVTLDDERTAKNTCHPFVPVVRLLIQTRDIW